MVMAVSARSLAAEPLRTRPTGLVVRSAVWPVDWGHVQSHVEPFLKRLADHGVVHAMVSPCDISPEKSQKS